MLTAPPVVVPRSPDPELTNAAATTPAVDDDLSVDEEKNRNTAEAVVSPAAAPIKDIAPSPEAPVDNLQLLLSR